MAVFVVGGGSQLRLPWRGSGAATRIGTLFLAGHEVRTDTSTGVTRRSRVTFTRVLGKGKVWIDPRSSASES
jgi:hypothetical protein